MALDKDKESQLKEIITSLNQWYDKSPLIDQNRANFLNYEDPRSLDDVRNEIAASWVRSKKQICLPQNCISPKMRLSSSSLHKVLRDNQKLLESATPILQEAESIYCKVNCFSIGLVDRNAILLLVRNFPLKQIRPGLDFSEDKVGTSAVSMSLAQKKPAYLLGSEIYNEVLRRSQFIASIPIYESSGKIAAFFVAPYFQELQYTKQEKQLLSFLVSWQFSIAQKIQDAVQNNSPKLIIPKPYCLRDNHKDREKSLEAVYSFRDIFGHSAAMTKTKEIAQRIAQSPGNILLSGESGTGKELFAHAVHKACCSQKPFVAINCAAIPKSLIECEMFGYEGGSFTGAERKGRMGKLEMANGGTLFLDEIADMPLELQPVLLRVLEDKKVMRIGGYQYIPVHFRVIAATNKDLYQMVINKEFREDLYFRLAALKIQIPPLRDRENDILDLAREFILETCGQLHIPPLEMDKEVAECLLTYHWPGNIRELKNAILWAVSVADQRIRVKDLPPEISQAPDPHTLKGLPRSTDDRTNRQFEQETIQKTMLRCQNNLSKAARMLGISRPTLYRKLESFGWNRNNL